MGPHQFSSQATRKDYSKFCENHLKYFGVGIHRRTETHILSAFKYTMSEDLSFRLISPVTQPL